MKAQRILCWLVPMLAWFATLVAGLQVAVHFWFPPLIEDALRAVDTILQGVTADTPAWAVVHALAAGTGGSVMKLALPFVALVVAANLVASGLNWAFGMAARRFWAKAG